MSWENTIRKDDEDEEERYFASENARKKFQSQKRLKPMGDVEYIGSKKFDIEKKVHKILQNLISIINNHYQGTEVLEAYRKLVESLNDVNNKKEIMRRADGTIN